MDRKPAVPRTQQLTHLIIKSLRQDGPASSTVMADRLGRNVNSVRRVLYVLEAAEVVDRTYRPCQTGYSYEYRLRDD